MFENCVLFDQGKSLLGGFVSYDTVFTVVFTLITSFTVLFVKERIKSYSNKNFLKKLLKYFLDSLESLQEPIDIQIKVLEELEKSIVSTEDDFIFRQNHKLLLNDVQNISKFDLYGYIISRKRKNTNIKYFNNMIKSIEFLQLHKVRIQSNFDIFLDKFTSYQSQWTNQYNSFIDVLYEYLNPIIIKKTDSIHPFLYLINAQINNFKRNHIKSYSNMNAQYNELISPLRDLCKAHPDNIYSANILQHIDFLGQTYNHTINLQRFYSTLYKSEIASLIGNKELITEGINYYRKEFDLY